MAVKCVADGVFPWQGEQIELVLNIIYTIGHGTAAKFHIK